MRFLKGCVSASAAIIDAILPYRCLKCDVVVGRGRGLCVSCFGAVHFLDAAAQMHCRTCCFPLSGSQYIPFGRADPYACNTCTYCQDNPFRALESVRAACVYDGFSRSLILAFKHADRTDMADTFAVWMGRVAGSALMEVDLIVPVPLHPLRLAARLYNQAALLAQRLARKHPRAMYSPFVLSRLRHTESQGHRGRAERHANVAGAFQVNQQYRADVSGRKILLVDDVMTSGATLDECAQMLRDSNALSVSALVLARAPLKT